MSVRNWGYRCELTLPQIELMQTDLPHTLYIRKNDKGGGKKNTVASDEVIRLQEEANRRMRERKKKQKQEDTYSVDELFRK